MKKKPATTSSRTGQPGLFARLADLYERMQASYSESARAAGLDCSGCHTNCCTSYFRHHTYVEWAYLWRGLQGLPDERRAEFLERAHAYVQHVQQCLAVGIRPTAMCPLNEDGLCVLYSHRLMICRLHGTPNTFTLPDGRSQVFPGCDRYAALAEANGSAPPPLERTVFYRELAGLEREFQQRSARPLPRVDLTLAEMIVLGPPKFR